jgi:hypothetical protein
MMARVISVDKTLGWGILFSLGLAVAGCGESAPPTKTDAGAAAAPAPSAAPATNAGKASKKKTFPNEPSAQERRAAKIKAEKEAAGK